jgi:hypothetical protein
VTLSISQYETPCDDGAEQPLALGSLGHVRRELRAQLREFIPGILENLLRAPISIDKNRIGLGVMDDQREGGVAV